MGEKEKCEVDGALYAMVGMDYAFHGWTSKCKKSECRIFAKRACSITPEQIAHASMTDLLSESNKESALHGSSNPRWKRQVLRIRAPVFDGFFVRALFVMSSA